MCVLVLACVPATAHAQPPSKAQTTWVHSAFAQCVRLRESHNGADPNADGNLYGVENPGLPGGTYDWARSVSRTTQDRIAYRLYQRYGVQPWRPYDGC